MNRLWYVVVAAAVAWAAAARLACLAAEFWLDEVWSLELARQAGSLVGVFGLGHDNNHHLNTAWLLLCPDAAPWWLYRLHVFAAGLAAVGLAAVAARPWGRAEAAFAAWLVGGCYWLALASAEARGYALAVCFALAAFICLRGYLDRHSRPALVGFWLASALGFLSHLTFALTYIGFLVWSLRRFGKERRSPGDELARLLRLHGVVAAFFAAFYLISLRGMEVGGGPTLPLGKVLSSLVGVGLGGSAAVVWLPLAAAAFAAGLWLLARGGDDSWAFFAAAVVAAPALFLLRRPPFVFERYFLIPFVFFLLVLARLLGELWRRGALPRVAAAAALLLFLAGGARHVWSFAESGRGRLGEALAWVAGQEPHGAEVTGDHDFRVGLCVRFHAGYLAAGAVRYRQRGEAPPRWLLAHRLDDRQEGRPPPGMAEGDGSGGVYRLVRQYPSRGPGCWGWFVYRRVP